MARVIILNGVSSVGKTTLAKAIQRAAATDFLHVSMDAFIAMVPDNREADPDWFPVEQAQTPGGPLTRISSGPRGMALLEGMRTTIAQLANSGFDVIVDEVCKADIVADFRAQLADHALHLVKVTADLSIMEQRERERGDRLIGLAREQAMHLHEGIAYDQEIDTGAHSPEDCARQILDALD